MLEQWTFERATELQHTASSPLPPESCDILTIAADLPTEVNVSPPLSLTDAIQHSEDRLFFVRYTPDETLRSRWYLVTVDLQQTAAEVSCGAPYETGWYYVQFLA